MYITTTIKIRIFLFVFQVNSSLCKKGFSLAIFQYFIRPWKVVGASGSESKIIWKITRRLFQSSLGNWRVESRKRGRNIFHRLRPSPSAANDMRDTAERSGSCCVLQYAGNRKSVNRGFQGRKSAKGLLFRYMRVGTSLHLNRVGSNYQLLFRNTGMEKANRFQPFEYRGNSYGREFSTRALYFSSVSETTKQAFALLGTRFYAHSDACNLIRGIMKSSWCIRRAIFPIAWMIILIIVIYDRT